MPDEKERVIWNGRPSQATNAGVFMLSGLFFWLVIPLLIAGWRYLSIRSTQYQITSERFRTRYGVLSKTIDEIELYRVRDYRIMQPLILRLFGRSHIVLETTDKTLPTFTILAVSNGEAVLGRLRQSVERVRQAKRVRSIDIGDIALRLADFVSFLQCAKNMLPSCPATVVVAR